jgi:tape measure domain-containing protein
MVADVSITTALEGIAQVQQQLGSLAKQLGGLGQVGTQATGGLQGFTTGVGKIQASVDAAASRLFTLRNTIVGAVTAGTVGKLIDYASEWENVSVRIGQFAENATQAKSIQDQLFASAQATGTEFQSVVETFARFAPVTKDLGLSADETISVIETLNQVVATSGATSEEASNALRQLAQGFAAGVVRGDELRSVSEQIPALLRVIAEESGTTTSELIADARENGIAVETIVKALQSQRDEVAASFAATGDTIARSQQRTENAFTALIGQATEASGVTDAFGEAIKALSSIVASDTALSLLTGLFREVAAEIRTAIAVVNAIGDAFTKVSGIVSGMVDAIDNLLGGRLASIIENAGRVLTVYESLWQGLSDRLVGNSIVPDMVTAIGAEFDRLPALVGDPTTEAAGAITEGFLGVADSFRDVERQSEIVRSALPADLKIIGENTKETAKSMSVSFSQFFAGTLKGSATTAFLINDAFISVANSVHQAFTTAFVAIIKNAESFSDIVKNLFSSIADAIINEFARIAVTQVFRVLFGGLGEPGGGSNAPGGALAAQQQAQSSVSSGGLLTGALAGGGLLSGGAALALGGAAVAIPAIIAAIEGDIKPLIATGIGAGVGALIGSAIGSVGGPLGAVIGGGLGGLISGFFQTGGTRIAQHPQLLMVGEHGPERIDITPLGGRGRGGSFGGGIHFHGPTILDEISLGQFERRLARAVGAQQRRFV